jgi:hypothetical protein
VHLPVGGGIHRLAGVDQFAPAGGERLGGQLRGRDLHFAGVCDIAEGVGEAQAHRFDEVVVGVRRLSAHGLYVEPLGDV